MKIKSFILSFLAVLAFVACNNEVINTSYEYEEEEVKEKGYLVLNLTNSPTTRTSGSETDAGTAEESVINSLMVVFTDATGTIISTTEPGFANGVTVKFQIALGTYDVYALINKPNEVVVTDGENIEQVIEVTAAEEATSGYKGGSFFMVNKRNNNSEKAGVSTTITSINSEQNPAIVNIYVDRVACKIVDETGTPTITNLISATGGLINNVEVEGYAVLNVNKKFNLIQKWSKDNTGGMTLNADVLSTPLYPGGASLIADQYFHNIGEYTTIEKDGKDSITSITDITLSGEIFKKGAVYTTENRPTIIANGTDNITAGRGETTGVIYKVKAKKDNDTDLGTFYIFKNVFYDDLDDIKALQEFDDQDWTSIEEDIPSLRALGIRVYEDGIMYYTYFIRDPNTDYRYEGKDYYGVFRNSTYKLAIKSISSVGDDVPGGAIVDPTKPGEPGNPPIETDETYLQVSVVVNKWILNTLDIYF